jgi:hypothetical protein
MHKNTLDEFGILSTYSVLYTNVVGLLFLNEWNSSALNAAVEEPHTSGGANKAQARLQLSFLS